MNRDYESQFVHSLFLGKSNYMHEQLATPYKVKILPVARISLVKMHK